MKHTLTKEHIDFLRENAPGRSFVELTEMFNACFGTDVKVTNLSKWCGNRMIGNGRDTRFYKGMTSHNKGKKNRWAVSSTCLKKGNIPHTHKPVGSETVHADGYTYVKIAERNVWREKHCIVYETAHGQIPAGHIVIFADGDRTNFKPDNLVCISRAQHVKINKRHLCGAAEHTKAAITLLGLEQAIRERSRKE
jgi:hypothetical protein